jgi:hypothetical protein
MSLTGNAEAKKILRGKISGMDVIHGEDGATFIPNVDSQGNLSWTNDKGLENPKTVNIRGADGEKGEKGEKGDTGPQGIQGEKGADGVIGKDGAPGADGYTPVKGVDYWTDEDKEEMVDGTLSAIPKVESGHTVIDGNVYTMTLTLDDGSTSTNVITVENGLPSKIVVDGVEMPLTWEVVKAALTALDLFRGVDNTEVTGGWHFQLWGYGDSAVKPTQTFTEDSMVISMVCTQGQSGAGAWLPVNQIDLTNVSKLKLKFDAIISGGSYASEFALACDKNVSNDASVWPNNRVQIAGSENEASVNVSDQEVTLDVSSLSGLYYVGIQVNANTAYADGLNMTLTIKELVME